MDDREIVEIHLISFSKRFYCVPRNLVLVKLDI